MVIVKTNRNPIRHGVASLYGWLRRSSRTAYARLLVKLLLKHGPIFLIHKIEIDIVRSCRNRTKGINVAGYFQYRLGGGEVARSFARILSRHKIPHALINLPAGSHPLLSDRENKSFDLHRTRKPYFETTLIFANGNYMKDVLPICPEIIRSRHRAGVWWWEFEDGMEDSVAGFDYIDEVVVFSGFVEQAIRRILPKGKILTKLPYPFYPDWKVCMDRDQLLRKHGIEPDRFVLYFNFDFASSIRRKNPMGILAALEKAFHLRDKIHLVIKTTNHEWFPDAARHFESALSRHPLLQSITWISEPLSHTEHYGLLGAIDCYVSLHRGEGLGLGMLESMHLGKPVIATNYGGNVEFTRPHNSMLVDYTLSACDDDYVIYRHVTRWAEPDIGQAAHYMRGLYENPERGKMLGRQARQDIQRQFNLDTCISQYRQWMARLSG
jgi:glycosyltransferase involved in cell wall biosynthesis